ncbi:NAMPT [Symbiodinium sp. CCMP2592]|nr:NAMPT [Symbiodinium sp. CCMP2592]
MAFSQDVLLGYVGRQLGPEELDVRLSRFGGTPVWSKEPSSESMLRRPDFFNCRLCGKPLVLFTQIAAGYGDRPKRLLHVFTCRASECSSDPLSWRVLRSTGKLATEAAEDVGHHRDPQSQGSGYPTSSATGDDWSVASPADDWSQPGCAASAKTVADDDWGAARAADDWSQPGASATAADDEIEALLAQRSTSAPVAKVPATPAKAKKAPLEAEEAEWQGVVANVGREDPLPCLSITIDYEPAPEEAAGEHEQELLQRYLHSELAEGEVDQMIASGALPKELQAEVESLRQEAQQEVTNDSEVYSYFESRGCDREGWNEVCFFGLQYFIKRYLCGQVITRAKIDEAAELCAEHFQGDGLFYKEGFEYILKKHGGRLPIEIKALPEGMVVPTKTALFTMVNTDPECFWLTNFLETLLVQVWYPMTVCSNSRYQKISIQKALEETGMTEWALPGGSGFKLHDFGFRGVSSVESAAIGGAAHLVNFVGTDTVAALLCCKKYYGSAKAAGFSIPASEHSTITSWGVNGEASSQCWRSV